MAGPVIYSIGAVLMHCPASLNPQEAVEEVGGDFAVKPIVGAQQPREFMGPSDTRLTLQGVIFPYRFAAAGLGDGQADLALLKTYCAQGNSCLVMRGDGTLLGFYFIERIQLRHTFLSLAGIGRRQEFALQLVFDPTGPTAEGVYAQLNQIRSIISLGA